AHDDVPGHDLLAAVLLDAAVFRVGVASVARGADALFMCHSKPRSAEGNVVDPNFGEALPMAALARVVLPALLLEDDDLVASPVPNDLAGHLGALKRGHAGLDRVAVTAEEDLVELDGAAGVAGESGKLIGAARLDTELLAAGLDDRVRHGTNDGEPIKLGNTGGCVNYGSTRTPTAEALDPLGNRRQAQAADADSRRGPRNAHLEG